MKDSILKSIKDAVSTKGAAKSVDSSTKSICPVWSPSFLNATKQQTKEENKDNGIILEWSVM